MKKVNLTLYSFDELSPEVQKKIIERERWNIMERCMDAYGSDYRNSLEEFEKLFDINCRTWEVGYCSYNYHFNITKYEAFEWRNTGNDYILLETLSGKLLLRYLQQNILPAIEKGKYYGTLIGTYPNCKHIKRYSKVIKEICCPFTGCCYDMYLLDPIIEYLKKPRPNITYENLMNECLNEFFKTWHEEYEYWADDENAIREELHNNEYEDQLYHRNGNVCTIPMEEAA